MNIDEAYSYRSYYAEDRRTVPKAAPPPQSVPQGGFSDSDMNVAISQSLGMSQDALLAMQLGIDEATYRMLKALENRDIRPEDYELLGELDKNIKPKTLDAKRLRIFPTEVYQGPQNATVCEPLPACDFGFWYWRREDEDDEEEQPKQIAKISSSDDVCGVCLMEFETGDEIRTLLPCGHRFHKDCIDHWLLEASTTCPVDKRELLVE